MYYGFFFNEKSVCLVAKNPEQILFEEIYIEVVKDAAQKLNKKKVEQAFNIWMIARSKGEGGYSDNSTDPEDVANAGTNLTSRGITTPYFYDFSVNELGIYDMNKVKGIQIDMMLGDNETPKPSIYKNIPINVPVGYSVYKKANVPILSEQERNNPTNKIYKSFMEYHWRKFTDDALTPALKFLFAEYAWAGLGWFRDFKKHIDSKLNLGLSSGLSITADDALKLNAREIDVIGLDAPYALERFRTNNSVETYNKYIKGWTNAVNNRTGILKSLTGNNLSEALSKAMDTKEFDKSDISNFFTKHKYYFIGLGAALAIALTLYILYKKNIIFKGK